MCRLAQLVADASLWDCRLLVFCETLFVHLCSNISTSTEATGVASVVGNNGAMAVSLSYRDTSFCFVSASLNSQHSKFIVRNDQVKEIVEGLRLGADSVDILNQFHHVVWTGNLNYRIEYGENGDQPTAAAVDALCADIAAARFGGLLETRDQVCGGLSG